MKHFITYGDSVFKEGKELLLQEARDLNMFDNVSSFSEDTISQNIKNMLKDILKCKKGSGFYTWKPLILQMTLNTIADNDIVVYADAGCTIINNERSKRRLTEYFEMISGPAMEKNLALVTRYVEYEQQESQQICLRHHQANYQQNCEYEQYRG